MTRALLGAGAAFVLASCAQIAQSRVESALVDNGVAEGTAACMAERMVDRLTIEQLKKLEALAPQDGEAKRPTGVRDFLRRLNRVGDAEVVAVTGSSAALCAAGVANEAR